MGKNRFSPRYSIDLESISRLHPALAQRVYSYLQDRISRPSFSLESECNHCERWDHGDRTLAPDKPGASCSRVRCAGCAFSYLDPIEQVRGRTEEEREQARQEFLDRNMIAINSIVEELWRIEYSAKPDKAQWEKLIVSLRERLRERAREVQSAKNGEP